MTKIESKYKSKILIWLVPIDAFLQPISSQEIAWKEKLPLNKSIQYQHSRGYVRDALSHVFRMSALDIPIISPPGVPPKLPNEMGYVSFSHCTDVLLIGWSEENIGVDIERFDRVFEADKIVKKIFSRKEIGLLKDLNDKEFNAEVLKLWVRKEAAIKWQKGSIFKDLSKWILQLGSNKIENKIDGYNLKSFLINHDNWYISIAYNNDSLIVSPIICKP